MSAPSDGIQSSVGLSNNIDVLSGFLNEQHSNNYIVFNLVSKQYNTQKFVSWFFITAKNKNIHFLICLIKIHNKILFVTLLLFVYFK